MVHYRRLRVRGGFYFFTATLQDRKSDVLTRHINILKDSWRIVQNCYPFKTIAYVILPDHFHTVWHLPEDDDNFSTRMRLFKTQFTKKLVSNCKGFNKNHRGEYNIWQKRFWEHAIRDEKDYETHINYIHYNPVKHGYVKRTRDWPYSSFHRYVKEGVLPIDWSDHECCDNLADGVE